MAGMLCPTEFIIDYHFKSSVCFEKRFEDGLGLCVFLKIFELYFGYALLSKRLVLLLAQMYQEYYNIV